MPDKPKRERTRAIHREHREARIEQDRCPECNGELDTGWECNDCGYDAYDEAVATPQLRERKVD